MASVSCESRLDLNCSSSSSSHHILTTSCSENKPQQLKKCPHYSRNCSIFADCCEQWFGCRICHDEEMNSFDRKNSHAIDRHAIQRMKCSLCQTSQPVGQTCINCNVSMSKYFCSVCNLFDDDAEKKQVFHCDKCGICRVGGRHNFFHCDTCGGCYSNGLKNNHKCIQGTMFQDCAICLENLFSSLEDIQVLRCGHALHSSCAKSLQPHSLCCPSCRSSLYDMTSINKRMKEEIDRTPMPEEYRDTMVDILCNDCHTQSSTNFHVIGLQCQECESFNTSRM